MTVIHDTPPRTMPLRWLMLAGFLLGSLAIVFWRGYDGVPLKPYHFTQYLFSYEVEFLKRGLPGEVFRQLFGTVTYDHATSFGWFMLAAYAVALAALAALVLVTLDFSRIGWLLATVVLTSPATFGHFIFDFGRMDPVLILLCAIGLVALCQWSARLTWPILAIVAVLSLLIHEAAFFMTMPLVFAVWLYTDRRTKSAVAQGVWAAGVIGLTYVISTTGLAQKLEFEPHLAGLEAQYGPLISHYALEVLFMDLQTNVSFSAKEAISRARALQHLFMLAVLAPLIIAYLRILLALFRARDIDALIVLGAALGPFLLYPLGHDHFRWWALATGNLFVATGVLLWLQNRTLRAALVQDRLMPALLGTAIVLGLVAGPLEVRASFDIAPPIIAAMGLEGAWAEL